MQNNMIKQTAITRNLRYPVNSEILITNTNS